jgi:putative hydrolase of the HAD superfamily
LSTMMIRALLVDLDGVIRFWDPAIIEDAERHAGLPAGAIPSTAFAGDLLEEAITGRISDDTWRAGIAARLKALYPDADAEVAVRMWSASPGEVVHEVLALVRSARKHVPVVLVTNATSRLDDDLRQLRLLKEFDAIANSSVVGWIKPQPEIYHHALGLVGARPDEALFVDDAAANVNAAIALGFRGHLFHEVGTLGQALAEAGLVVGDQ